MNEFTKEELEDIYNSLVMIINLHEAPDNFFELQAKILSMIDNYCEHEPSEPKLVLVKECLKCNCHLDTRPWGPEC